MTTEATAFDTNNPKGPVHLDEGDGQWRNRFFDSEQRRQELQVIVDKLPKDIEGNTVLPLDCLFVVECGKIIEVQAMCGYDKRVTGYSYAPFNHIHESCMHPTREAAEAALAEREREGGGDA